MSEGKIALGFLIAILSESALLLACWWWLLGELAKIELARFDPEYLQRYLRGEEASLGGPWVVRLSQAISLLLVGTVLAGFGTAYGRMALWLERPRRDSPTERAEGPRSILLIESRFAIGFFLVALAEWGLRLVCPLLTIPGLQIVSFKALDLLLPITIAIGLLTVAIRAVLLSVRSCDFTTMGQRMSLIYVLIGAGAVPGVCLSIVVATLDPPPVRPGTRPVPPAKQRTAQPSGPIAGQAHERRSTSPHPVGPPAPRARRTQPSAARLHGPSRGSAPTLVGDPPAWIESTPVQGGHALSFDGTDDLVRIADAPNLRPACLTLEGWVNFNSLVGTQVLFAKTAGAAQSESYIIWYGGSRLSAAVGDPGGLGPVISSRWVPVTGTWHHVAFTFDRAMRAQTLLVNGAVVASGTTTKSVGYDGHPLTIAAEFENETLAYFFRGTIDEVRLWDRARTPEAIRADMRRGLIGNETGLVGYWRFDEGIGSTTADASGHGSVGHLVNGSAAD